MPETENPVLTEAQKKVATARVQLLVRYPFYGMLLLGLDEEWNTPEIPTCGVTPSSISYNGEFFEKFTLEETIGVMAHEAFHLAMLHIFRRGKREELLWNIAADFAANIALLDDNMKLPAGVLVSGDYRDMSAEAIYDVLEKKKKGGRGKDKGQSKGQGQGRTTDTSPLIPQGQGQLDDHPWNNLPTGEELERLKREAVDSIIRAATIAKSAGNLPGQWEEYVSGLLRPQIDWKTRLYNWVTSNAKNDYRLFPPNKRWLWREMFLPGLKGEHLEIALAIDTSGSIGAAEFTTFISEMLAIADSFETWRIHYYQADAAIQVEKILETGDEMPRAMRGRGGTSYRPVFKKIAELEDPVCCLIYFTDGYPNDGWPKPIDMPVLWVSSTDVKAPWGETLRVKIEERI